MSDLVQDSMPLRGLPFVRGKWPVYTKSLLGSLQLPRGIARPPAEFAISLALLYGSAVCVRTHNLGKLCKQGMALPSTMPGTLVQQYAAGAQASF